MQNTLFKSSNLIDSYRNLQKKIQVVKFRDSSLVAEALKIGKLGDYSVECYVPFNNKYKIGVIGPIELDVMEDEMNELLSESNIPAKAKRLFKGHGQNAIKTKTMKLFLNKKLSHLILY